ncbi:MAG: response regulator [Chloroflexi bacterium]|nr:response regulator [Chloroflexota bacterium]
MLPQDLPLADEPAIHGPHGRIDADADRAAITQVLLIEDNPDNARLVQRVLARTDYRLMHAWDGESGLKLIMEYRPDIVLLDLGLPDIDGQTLATIIRRMPELADLRLIAVTAWPEETAREMVRAYGCDGFISKPINVRTFAQQIADFVAG